VPEKTVRQFGLWDSPITPKGLAESVRLSSVVYDSDGKTLVWHEGRSGRGVIVAEASPMDAPRDLTSDLSVRAEVGYGGGDFTVHGGYAYFAVHKDGRLFRQPLSAGPATPITPKFGTAASPVVSPDGRFVAYVHYDGEQTDVIGIVDVEGKRWPQILTAGRDFYMQPRWSPDRKRFAWIAWDFPNMPWDGTRLYVADVVESAEGLPQLGKPWVVAGGDDVAIFQPEFTRDGNRILYVSDETGWGRLRGTDLDGGESKWLTPDGVEVGWPAWAQDMRTYAVLGDGRSAVAAIGDRGFQRLHRVDLESGKTEVISELAEYSEISTVEAAALDGAAAAHPSGVAADSSRFVFAGSGPQIPSRIVEFDLALTPDALSRSERRQSARIVARSTGETIAAESLAECQPVSWPTANGETAHGLFYEPAGDRFTSTGKPPVVLLIHGGPTGQAVAAWSPNAQFFATRGYAVLVVNYRGSTGYGREYMLRLRGNWGVCDVEDSLSGVRYLAGQNLIDPDRTVIMGGSAGGFTVLQTLSQHPDSFTAGVSLYGVANQFGLAADTHKFETRYTDTMIGPLPDDAQKYYDRSPEYHAHRIQRPLAVYQGEIDKVVPKGQSDAIVEALKRSGTPHIYHCYKGEGHGWRKRETIEHFYSSLEAFLREHVIYSAR
jgi:dipeptidyl aminopeptidase/acylaminoacyl peptidase